MAQQSREVPIIPRSRLIDLSRMGNWIPQSFEYQSLKQLLQQMVASKRAKHAKMVNFTVTIRGKKHVCHLNHSIIQLAESSKDGGHVFRITKKQGVIAEGGYGQVKQVLSGVILTADDKLQLERGHRVVKVQALKRGHSLNKYLNSWNREVYLTRLCLNDPIETVIRGSDHVVKTYMYMPDLGMDLLYWIDTPAYARASQKRILSIAAKICERVAAIHEKSIVHRDLKPDNIMISANGDVEVVDFGLSREAKAGDFARPEDKAQNLSVSGTPGYFAPECVIAKETCPGSDVYALAYILAILLGANTKKLMRSRNQFERGYNRTLNSKTINKLPQRTIDALSKEICIDDGLAKITDPVIAEICIKFIKAMASNNVHDRPTAATCNELFKFVELTHSYRRLFGQILQGKDLSERGLKQLKIMAYVVMHRPDEVSRTALKYMLLPAHWALLQSFEQPEVLSLMALSAQIKDIALTLELRGAEYKQMRKPFKKSDLFFNVDPGRMLIDRYYRQQIHGYLWRYLQSVSEDNFVLDDKFTYPVDVDARRFYLGVKNTCIVTRTPTGYVLYPLNICDRQPYADSMYGPGQTEYVDVPEVIRIEDDGCEVAKMCDVAKLSKFDVIGDDTVEQLEQLAQVVTKRAKAMKLPEVCQKNGGFAADALLRTPDFERVYLMSIRAYRGQRLSEFTHNGQTSTQLFIAISNFANILHQLHKQKLALVSLELEDLAIDHDSGVIAFTRNCFKPLTGEQDVRADLQRLGELAIRILCPGVSGYDSFKQEHLQHRHMLSEKEIAQLYALLTGLNNLVAGDELSAKACATFFAELASDFNMFYLLEEYLERGSPAADPLNTFAVLLQFMTEHKNYPPQLFKMIFAEASARKLLDHIDANGLTVLQLQMQFDIAKEIFTMLHKHVAQTGVRHGKFFDSKSIWRAAYHLLQDRKQDRRYRAFAAQILLSQITGSGIQLINRRTRHSARIDLAAVADGLDSIITESFACSSKQQFNIKQTIKAILERKITNANALVEAIDAEVGNKAHQQTAPTI